MTAPSAQALTARVGYQAAGRDEHGRISRETYHAVFSGGPVRVLRIGWASRRRGEALCGAAPLADCPPGLFPPVVSCPACRAIAAAEHIEIEGDEQ